MCTVSFINFNDSVFITSNRDEKISRGAAKKPKTYLLNGRKVTFPMDPKGRGTWFAINDLQSAIVLLNGAKEKHLPKPFYRKSRGLVVLELISAENSLDYWETIDLSGIEPFTIVLYFKQQLYQLRWDEVEKDTKELDTNGNYIWSSSTLYTEEIRIQRQHWFKDFLEKNPHLDSNKILGFHSESHPEDKTNGLIIKRSNELQTVNITQLILHKNIATFKHKDLVNNLDFKNTTYFI